MINRSFPQDEKDYIKGQVYDLVVRELERRNLHYEAQVVVHDFGTTGVQGDARTYCPLVQITLLRGREIMWDKEFANQIGTEIINNVIDTNRVVVTIPHD